MKTIFALSILFFSVKLFALDPNHFTITRISAPYFIVDGNSPATVTKAYVGFEVKNNTNSATTYSGLRFSITSIGTSVTGQNYSVISPVSGVINIGTLAPGETKVCYYYIAYPASVTPQGTFNVKISDNTASSKTQSFLIYNRSAISANAGGTATQTITNQDLIGGVITDDVVYVVGNVQNGDENDFQVAVSAQFDPTKVILLSTKVIASNVPGIPVNTTDSLYFISGNGSNGSSITIRWTFKISATNFTTYLLPCAGATSGNTNYKYALNTSLGQGSPITVSSSSNPLVITKISDLPLYTYGSIATFTITISNPGIYPVTIDKITDELPAGFTYQALSVTSQVTAANSTSTPSVNATGTITFEGGVLSGANSSYLVPAGGSIKLIYTATAPSFNEYNVITTARHFVSTSELGFAQNTLSVSGALPISLASFKAFKENEMVKIVWTTADESNSDHFEIQRSNGFDSFASIGEKMAAGNSYSLLNYSFSDSFPLKGNNYYRLKMVDRDNKFRYSSILLISQKLNDPRLARIFDNPFTSSIRISYASEREERITVVLSDIKGKKVAIKSSTCNAGANSIFMDGLENLHQGIYIMQIVTGSGVINEKLFKLH